MSAAQAPDSGSVWTLRRCIAAALATVAVGLAGALLITPRPPDDAFRARLEEYRRIGESFGRAPPPRPAVLGR